MRAGVFDRTHVSLARRLRSAVVVWGFFLLPLTYGLLNPLLLGRCIAQENQFSAGLADSPESRFLSTHCLECHHGSDPQAGLDLQKLLERKGSSQADLESWVRIHDRVQAGEMPPQDYPQPSSGDRSTFVEALGRLLKKSQQNYFASEGRVQGRRLTNLQLEWTLHDLLGIDVPLTGLMTDEQRTGGFATVASGQSMSHFQLEQHLNVVDTALAEAFRRLLQPSEDQQLKQLSAQQIARVDPKRRCREPEMLGDAAVVWASRLIFYGRLPCTTAREAGWYRFTMRVSSRKSPTEHGVWCTVRSGPCISSAPLLAWVGAFEAFETPREVSFEAWLPKGHMLEVRPADTTLRMAAFQGGQVGVGEGDPQEVPGLNLHEMTIQRIHRGPDQDAIRKLLVGSIDPQAKSIKQPEQELSRLVHRFAETAFRSPVDPSQSQPYIQIALDGLRQGQSFFQALQSGYRAVLCAPRFIYLVEAPGRLDDYALANRLSYFLWNSMPDAELFELARQQKLRSSEVLLQQVSRMLRTDRGQLFVRDLAEEWLDLRLIDFTEPDRRLYPTFDIIVQQSMLEETHLYLQEMLQRNASVTELIDSSHTYLNSRLARFYEIDGVQGDQFQRVKLTDSDQRGGVLTQGAILKVTANGTTTSPVIRGVWIGERLLGEHIPPPPESVPAIEPDIRGATSIRELLAKHRSDSSCAACHVKIDPPGFALENYDPSGRYRTTYGKVDKKKPAVKVDASYTTAAGESFANVKEFRQLICAHPERLAKNMSEKLLTVGTGALPTFADRGAVESIVKSSAANDYGLRSLIEGVVLSQPFQTK